MDEPQPLGKYETGAKTAMPVFKEFIKKAIKKKDATPFKVPDNIIMMVVDLVTGEKADFTSKKTIIEAFKIKDVTENFTTDDYLNLKVYKNNILKFY